MAPADCTPARSSRAAAHPAGTLFDAAGQTLEDSILRVWEDLVANGSAGCPVCGETMRAGQDCSGCGSNLS